jgi:hypothetical protein
LALIWNEQQRIGLANMVLISASAVALRSHWYKSLELCQKGLSESYLLPPLFYVYLCQFHFRRRRIHRDE